MFSLCVVPVSYMLLSLLFCLVICPLLNDDFFVCNPNQISFKQLET